MYVHPLLVDCAAIAAKFYYYCTDVGCCLVLSLTSCQADEDGDEIDIADDSDLNDAKKLAQEGKLELNYSSGNN